MVLINCIHFGECVVYGFVTLQPVDFFMQHSVFFKNIMPFYNCLWILEKQNISRKYMQQSVWLSIKLCDEQTVKVSLACSTVQQTTWV